MSKYTLQPNTQHGVPRKEVVRQFLYFLNVIRKNNIFEFGSAREVRSDFETIRRFGTLESGALANTARRHPERLGLVDDDGELTFGECFEQVTRLATGLLKNGVEDGSNVAVMALNGRAAIFPLCARQMAGYHIFMINANSSGPQIERVLEFHEVKTLIVDQCFYERLTETTKKTCQIIIGHVEDSSSLPEGVLTMEGIIEAGSPNLSLLPKKPTKSQHVVMTSGTTGMPKGVVRRQLKSPQGIGPVLDAIPWRRDMSVLLTGVLFHFYGWGNMLLCLFTGSTIITQRNFDSAKALEQVERYGVDAWISSASRLRGMIGYLDKNGIDRVPGLEFVTSSGSPLTPYEVQKVNQKFGPIFHNCYGSTETSGLAISAAEDLAADPTLTGTIHPGSMIEIRNDDGQVVPDGEVGEIFAGAYDMFAGYTDPSIDIKTQNGLLRMGDRGYKKGNKLYVGGRADDLVITQYGEKIFPSELEDLLIRDSRVAEVHVHGVQDPDFGQALRAYIIREDGVNSEELTEDEVRRLVREGLSDAHTPRDVFFVTDLPRNPMGKVIRPELPGKSTA